VKVDGGIRNRPHPQKINQSTKIVAQAIIFY
jgi:hypothetical protein